MTSPRKIRKIESSDTISWMNAIEFVSHSGYEAVLKFTTLIVLVFLFGLKTVFIYWSLVTHICGSEPGHHDDVIKSRHFPRYWPFVRGIHRSPVNFPHKGQWRGALIFSLICAWINGWETIVRLVIWDAIAPIVTSLLWLLVQTMLCRFTTSIPLP